jgi:ABC-type multidrug transport system fused ATPase/permease subunit
MTNIKLIKSILDFSKPFRTELLLVFLCVFLTSAIEAVTTYLLGEIFNIAQKHSTEQSYLEPAIYLVVFALVTYLIKTFIVTYQQRLEVRKLDVAVANHLNHASISRYFKFSNGQHINEHSGVKQNIITTGFTSVQNQMNMFIYQFFPSLSNFIVSLVVLFSISLTIGFTYLGVTILFIYSMYYFNKMMQPKIREVRDARNETSRTISELYRYVFLIKNEVAEKKSIDDLDNVQSLHQKSYSSAWIVGINWLTAIKIGTSLFRYLTIGIGVYLLFSGQITAGSIFLIFTWSNHFINSLWMITDMQKQFITDKINIEKYFEILQIEPDVKEVEQPIENDFAGDIEFNNVKFKYPGRKSSHDSDEVTENDWVLKGVTFNIKQGQKVAFVGESGSGKSTIANLVRRAFDPQEGEIKINNHLLKEISLSHFLQKIGSVDQEVILFDKSLRENISFGTNRLLTDEELNKIAKLSRIDSFYPKLEHGWDTIVGEKGSKISGGEKQRIGIARALAKNPEILIFDEATSALDTVSEKVVQRSIDVSCKGKTSIIIAHRLSTVKNCDKIFVLRNGEIIGEGTHQELLESCEYYADLIKNQLSHKLEKV